MLLFRDHRRPSCLSVLSKLGLEAVLPCIVMLGMAFVTYVMRFRGLEQHLAGARLRCMVLQYKMGVSPMTSLSAVRHHLLHGDTCTLSIAVANHEVQRESTSHALTRRSG